MRDRRAERPSGGKLRIDVDRLPVLGRLGERIDPILGDLEPRRNGLGAARELADHAKGPQRTTLAAQV